MTVRKILLEVDTIVTENGREPDIDLEPGFDMTVLEDKGLTMIVKVTACDNSVVTNKPVSASDFLAKKPKKGREILSHPMDAVKKRKYVYEEVA